MSRTAIGVFEPIEAERVLDELVREGFGTDGISVLSHEEAEKKAESSGRASRCERRAVRRIRRVFGQSTWFCLPGSARPCSLVPSPTRSSRRRKARATRCLPR